jgi:carbonic anhydrase/acetyltransferase-like protein (isoleucine patch superfamily)
MQRWNSKVRVLLQNETKPQVSKFAKVNPKAEITGKVFIGDHVSIGKSKIYSENENVISIGENTQIKDGVVISARDYKYDPNLSKIKKLKDIYIGCKIFISSDVVIQGSSIISDGVFLGSGCQIVNSHIGPNSVIEAGAIVKNVTIPANTFVPSKAIINSMKKLNCSTSTIGSQGLDRIA